MPNTRGWCFTLNNPKKHNGLQLVDALKAECTYIIIGREYAPDTHTPHYQGYCVFRNPKSLKQLKELNKKVHWEKRKKTHDQAADYCKKEDKNPFEYGDNRQGERSDLNAVVEMAQQGASVYEISRTHPATYIRNHNGIEKWVQMSARAAPGPREAKPHVSWYWGPSGTGKTQAAASINTDTYFLDNINDMTGYEGQNTVIIDDFRQNDIPFNKLLRLLDRYPLRLNKKFGSVNFNSPVIVITAPYHPAATFDTDEDTTQLLRRIDIIREFEKFENFKNMYPDNSDNTQNEDSSRKRSSQVPPVRQEGN